jgi:hypothetical protein
MSGWGGNRNRSTTESSEHCTSVDNLPNLESRENRVDREAKKVGWASRDRRWALYISVRSSSENVTRVS